MPHCLVVKLLVIQPVLNTIQEGLKIEQETRPFLKDGLLLDVTVVRDCMTGLEQLRYSIFDVIMVYQNVDYVTGVEFIRILRRIEDYTPVIFVLDNVTQTDVQTYGLEIGFHSVLVKPIHPGLLVDEILSIMNEENEATIDLEQKPIS
jgi:DNA-binding response OmpR family regulator